MQFLDAVFTGLENFAASRLGIQAYFIPGASLTYNRQVLIIPTPPDPVDNAWRLISLVETKLNPAENFTGLLENNPDVLTGENPAERAFIVRQFEFNEPPTIDDRLILLATGQNFSISNVDSVAEIGATGIAYRLICRALN